MQDNVILPDYYRVLECRGEYWYFKKSKPFYTLLPFQVDYQDFELLYGISKQQVVNELHQMKNGAQGFYLANLRQKRYYYCGTEFEDVHAMLRSLGIRPVDPNQD